MDAGPGNDFMMGGDGQDFMNGGANDNEEFAGPGNDFIMAGQGADAPFGDGGDDWMEFGTGQDIGAGDHEAPFFDDPGELQPGNDVMIGQPGENDYDAEGGDDVMAQDAAISRNAGASGYDWAIHQYDSVPANDDMMINNNLGGVPIQVVVNRDRWQETEADSGSSFNDVIMGNDGVVGLPRVIGAGGGGFSGCDVLDQAALDRIKGLAAIVRRPAGQGPTLQSDVNAPQPDVDPALSVSGLTSVAGLSAGGRCPQVGPFWGEGDVLLGGAGSDSITGRGGNDVIDGDQELRVRISVRTDPANPATEIGTTDLLEHQYLRDAAGNPTGPTLQDAIMAGQVDPGNLVTVRELVNNAGPADVDTSVYSGPLSQYTITRNTDGSVTVCDSVSVAVVAAGGRHPRGGEGRRLRHPLADRAAAVRRPDGEPGRRDRTRGHDEPDARRRSHVPEHDASDHRSCPHGHRVQHRDCARCPSAACRSPVRTRPTSRSARRPASPERSPQVATARSTSRSPRRPPARAAHRCSSPTTPPGARRACR